MPPERLNCAQTFLLVAVSQSESTEKSVIYHIWIPIWFPALTSSKVWGVVGCLSLVPADFKEIIKKWLDRHLATKVVDFRLS